MENKETFLQLKLTSQKSKLNKNIIGIIIGSSFLGIVLSFLILGSCVGQHIILLNDIQEYEKTLDPEFCESIVYRIDVFNEECEPEIEILDCG